MLRNRLRIGTALLGIAVLSLSHGPTSARAAEYGGLYSITRPNGIVMVVELYGYEVEDAKGCQKMAYDEALSDWTYGASEWGELVKGERGAQ